ncbi:MAG: hypothetical protein Q9165_007164 [Trypethelium subeluteriae]
MYGGERLLLPKPQNYRRERPEPPAKKQRIAVRVAYANETSNAALKREVQELKKELKNQEQFFDSLKQLPTSKALELLEQLKAVDDSSVALFSLHGSLMKKQRPSDHVAARGMSPPTQTNLEFELMARHKNVYLALDPVDLASMKFSPLTPNLNGRPSSPGHASSWIGTYQVHEVTLSPHELFVSHDDESSLLATTVTSTSPRSSMLSENRAMSGPPRAPTYVDERLHRLRIRHWTSVPIDDSLAASIISSYLELDHVMLGFFDVDLFLSDLAEQQLRYCSAFLVSSLLYMACVSLVEPTEMIALRRVKQSYTLTDLGSSPLAKAFFKEAEMLWIGERSCDSVTTAAAIQLFAYGCASQGRDDLSGNLLAEGRRMAERLHLFGRPHDDTTAAYFASLSPDDKRAASHTAWGIHNWLT